MVGMYICVFSYPYFGFLAFWHTVCFLPESVVCPLLC